jgi:ribonuclease Z
MAVLLLSAGSGAMLRGTDQAPAPAANDIRVTLLGTAAGPPVYLDRAGIATLVEAGGARFLFDAGRGVMLQLARAGVRMDGVTKLFLTHLHSDHIIDVPDLMLSPWSAPSERKVPLEVWGPEGTRDMMHHLEQAFAYDIHVRRDVDEGASAEGIKVIATDIREGKVYEQNGVTITAFLVDHGPVKPAYGYRVDYAGRSVALSGDTRPSDNLVTFCKGVDVLIHEAIDPEALRRQGPSARLFKAIIEHHTTPEQAADLFARVKPRLAVFSHSAGTPAIVEGTRRTYSGRVEMGEDLMVLDIGDEVRVRRPGQRE